MSETTTVSASDILCNLRAVVADLECQQKQQLFKQLQQQLDQEQQMRKRQQQQQEQNNNKSCAQSGQQPMFLMIPIEDAQKCEGDKRSRDCGHDHDNSCSKGSTHADTKTCKGSTRADTKTCKESTRADTKTCKESARADTKTCNGNTKKSHHNDPTLELKAVKSRELRAGVLYTGCGCMHRDGLQDDCPRSECQGQPGCLVKPWPVCPPGVLCRSRHAESFGTPPNPDAVTF